MEINNEEMGRMLEKFMELAKSNRERVGYKGSFTQVCVVIGPKGEMGVTPMFWKDADEKHIITKAISLAARETKALAVVVVCDMRWTDSTKFCIRFGLAQPDGTSEDYERFQREYLDILKLYGGSMDRLPSEVWNEALLVACKGPMIEEKGVLASYKEGVGDSIMWTDNGPITEDGIYRNYLIEDWWDEVTKQ